LIAAQRKIFYLKSYLLCQEFSLQPQKNAKFPKNFMRTEVNFRRTAHKKLLSKPIGFDSYVEENDESLVWLLPTCQQVGRELEKLT
jgi:hypothetical protein